MSMLLMVKAMQTKVGNPLRKLVYLKLADNANDEGVCWPSLTYISDQCEISRRSVINHINKLEEMGLLYREVREGEKGQKSNKYHLSMDLNNLNPSAGNALPPKKDSAAGAPPSAADAPRSAADALPPSAGDAPRISHSLEPVNEPVIEPKENIKEPLWKSCPDAVEVLEHLNLITESNFKKTTDAHIRNINARLKEGATVNDCKMVIEFKSSEWKDKPSMCQYLRPATLFNGTKYQGYIRAAKLAYKNQQSGLDQVSDLTRKNFEAVNGKW